jgi:RNA polymerase sigma-70 factor (family 1)
MLTENEKPYSQFKSVFEKYYQPLCNYAYSFTKDRSACEDIVQEVFARVWEKKQDIISSDAVRYYLFTAVRNNSLSFIEHKKKSAGLIEEDIVTSVEIFPAEEQNGIATDNLMLIKKGLALLPPKCKDTFLLSRIGNLSYKEIAVTMGVSVKTVENQIAKAIRTLRDFMKQQKVSSFFLALVFIHDLYRSGIGDFTKLLFS